MTSTLTRPAPVRRRTRRVHHRDPVPDPHHVAQAGPRDHHDGVGPGQQVVVAALGPDPAAVGDHVGVGHARQRRADLPPQRVQAGALLGVGYADQHVQAAAQLLRVLPDLPRLQAPARGDGQAEQPAPRVEPAAVGRRQPVDQVAAGRVALGEQHRPGPHRGQGHRGRRYSRRSLVGSDSDQRHGSVRSHGRETPTGNGRRESGAWWCRRWSSSRRRAPDPAGSRRCCRRGWPPRRRARRWAATAMPTRPLEALHATGPASAGASATSTSAMAEEPELIWGVSIAVTIASAARVAPERPGHESVELLTSIDVDVLADLQAPGQLPVLERQALHVPARPSRSVEDETMALVSSVPAGMALAAIEAGHLGGLVPGHVGQPGVGRDLDLLHRRRRDPLTRADLLRDLDRGDPLAALDDQEAGAERAAEDQQDGQRGQRGLALPRCAGQPPSAGAVGSCQADAGRPLAPPAAIVLRSLGM